MKSTWLIWGRRRIKFFEKIPEFFPSANNVDDCFYMISANWLIKFSKLPFLCFENLSKKYLNSQFCNFEISTSKTKTKTQKTLIFCNLSTSFSILCVLFSFFPDFFSRHSFSFYVSSNLSFKSNEKKQSI